MATFTLTSLDDTPPIVVGSYEEPPRPADGRNGGPFKVTAEQIREIWQLYQDGTSPTEIGALYDLSVPTIINIGRGKEYRWATPDLRGEGPPIVLANPTPTPEPVAAVPPPTQEEETPVTVTTAPLDTAPSRPLDIQAPAVEPQPCETTSALPPIYSDGRLVPTALLTDLAEALETMLDQQGKPMRRFIMLDLGAMRALVKEARALATIKEARSWLRVTCGPSACFLG